MNSGANFDYNGNLVSLSLHLDIKIEHKALGGGLQSINHVDSQNQGYC